jgi:uncharacterized protein
MNPTLSIQPRNIRTLRTTGHGLRLSLAAVGALIIAHQAQCGDSVSWAKLQNVPFTQVEIKDQFWAPRRETNRIATIPTSLRMLEKYGNIRNLELAASNAHAGYSGPVFMDSDLYKALEAAAYSLATHPDAELDHQVEAIIAKIAAAQLPNGYLDTHFQVNAPDQKWTNLRDWHELYCAGHLFEAAVAHYQATGKRSLLNVAIKLADHIDSVFGATPGKRMGYPGHPEIELALVKLGKITGERRYFELARFFIENRGRKFFAEEHHTPLDQYDGTYWQDDVPIRDHKNIKGHAVRAAYLLSGAVDVASETHDDGLLKMIDRVWRNTTYKNTYITGGIGPSSHNEGFTEDYDLPNQTAYQETCATIALALWNHRLALLYGDARYADVVERALYNGVLSGVSQDGNRFFYVNPLTSDGHHHRSPWFSCACCPPNVARTLASLGGYAYAVSDQALYVNLYIQGTVNTRLKGKSVRLEVTTDYPWNGRIQIKPHSELNDWQLRLRVPGWCTDARVKVNGRTPAQLSREHGYLILPGPWRSHDTVELNLAMPVQRVCANPNVKADAGLQAIQRGPLVYCLEACDQTLPLSALFLAPGAVLKTEIDRSLFGGMIVIKGLAQRISPIDWERRLYQPAPTCPEVPVRAIPYYAWDNRAPGSMQVWLPLAPATPPAGGLEKKAKEWKIIADDE